MTAKWHFSKVSKHQLIVASITVMSPASLSVLRSLLFMADLLDGSFVILLPGSSAALSLSRLRPVTLRAILSDGLPFSSFCYFKNNLLSLICGRFAGRIFMISVPGSSAALSPYEDLGQ